MAWSNTRATEWRKRVELPLLLRERLDDAHAGDVLLGLRGQLGDPLLHLLQRRPRPAAVAERDQHDERHRRQRERRESRLQREHRHRREQQRQQRLRDEDQPVAEEEADRLKVDGRARHQLTGLLAVEERQLEPLELGVQAVAQVELDAERHPAGDEPANDAQAQPSEAGDADRDRPDRQPVAVVVADRVDRSARQVRDQYRRHHRAEGERERPGDAPLVGLQKAEQSPEDEHTSESIVTHARAGVDGHLAQCQQQLAERQQLVRSSSSY